MIIDLPHQAPEDPIGQVPTLRASSFQRELSSGRTRPCVFWCEDPNGVHSGEFVVKLHSAVDTGIVGLVCELVAALLARRLGLSVPDPALIDIGPDLAAAIPNQHVQDHAQRSLGLNYGCKFLRGGYSTWPKNTRIPEYLVQTALRVFIFDALVDNPDRRPDKPNLLWRSNELILIDHEAAFSFLYAINIGSAVPWEVSKLSYLRQHVLRGELVRVLRGGLVHGYSAIGQRIASLSEADWTKIEQLVPPAWKKPELAKIRNHVMAIVRNHEAFIQNIKQLLR